MDEQILSRSRALPVFLYTAGSLSGEPMTPQQMATAIHGGRDLPAVRAVIRVIEAYANEATALAMHENANRDGLATKFLMASSFMANILVDLREYADGRVPGAHIHQPFRPRRPDPEKS